VLGSDGNDDLTLNVYGSDDPDLLNALIDGGTGIDIAITQPMCDRWIANADSVYSSPSG